MSLWTYINGTVTVSPMGRTQEEKEYILKTVLNHLPLVTGSEEDMHVDVLLKKSGCRSSCSHDEFQMMTNNLVDRYGCKNRDKGWMNMYEDYIIVVHGSLRDRVFEETYKEFIKWLTRLSKRVDVRDVLVQINGDDLSGNGFRKEIITNKEVSRHFDTQFGQMFENPSWCNDDGEPNWCEYLMWEANKGSGLPRLLEYKYYNNEENDKLVESWIERK